MLAGAFPGARLVRATSVDGRLVFVIDGAVPDAAREQLYACLMTDAFRRAEFATQETREYRHHVVSYSIERMKRTELFEVVDRLVQALFVGPGEPPLDVFRIYTNALLFGDVAFAHRDALDERHVTALAYPNPEWAHEFGGETLFYDEHGEIVDAVEPWPGRLVLFKGTILHKGSPPSRLVWGTRFTTAFKFGPLEDEPAPGRCAQREATS